MFSGLRGERDVVSGVKGSKRSNGVGEDGKGEIREVVLFCETNGGGRSR